jgi:hypothetical protein
MSPSVEQVPFSAFQQLSKACFFFFIPAVGFRVSFGVLSAVISSFVAFLIGRGSNSAYSDSGFRSLTSLKNSKED